MAMRPQGQLGPVAVRRFALKATAALAFASASCDTPIEPRLELALSQASVELRAIRGSTALVVHSVTVTNGGGGRLGPVTCPETPAAWLTCTVSGGNVVTLMANPSGLTASPASVAVPLSAPGAPEGATLVVAFVIEEPVLSLSRTAVDFTATENGTTTTPASATVTVTNAGSGTLASLGTLSCTPTPPTTRVTCAVDPSSGQLTFSVNPSGLDPGTYLWPVAVSASNAAASQTVSVTLTIGALPRIALSRTAVHFQAVRGAPAPAAQTVSVSNAGGGSLGNVSCPANPASWLACSVSGSTVTFSVNPSGLETSPAPVAVNVSAAGAVNSPAAVTVSLAVEQPVLTLGESAVSFTAQEGATTSSPSTRTVTVTNTGGGTLANLGAISCTPPTGAPVTCGVNAATGVLTLSVNPTGRAAGVWIFPVSVSAPNSGVARVLNVTLFVNRLTLSPSVLNFTAIRGTTTALTDTVRVSNPGGGPLGTITCPASPAAWLTCTVTDSTRVTFTANPTGLTASPNPVNVTVTATGAVTQQRTVTVSLKIEQPSIAVTPTRRDIAGTVGGPVVPTTVTVSNAGAGTLANLGTVSCAAGGAPVTCSAMDPATGQLTLNVTPPGAAGTYVYVVSVSGTNSNVSQSVTIVLTVT